MAGNLLTTEGFIRWIHIE